jgi:hypothetical protein
MSDEHAMANMRRYVLKQFPKCKLIKQYLAIFDEYSALVENTSAGKCTIHNLYTAHKALPIISETLPEDGHITYAHVSENARSSGRSLTEMMRLFINYKRCVDYYYSPAFMSDVHQLIALHTHMKQIHGQMLLIDKYVDLTLTANLYTFIDSLNSHVEWCTTFLNPDSSPINSEDKYIAITFAADCTELYRRALKTLKYTT